MLHTIKQLEEKNVANEIVHMVWSDRMDLVAYSTVKGEVALHRLTWTRAWSLSPPLENLSVKGLAWRPDGKVLAIAYSNGQVTIVSIENKLICKNIEINGDISCIHWVQEKHVKNDVRNENLPFNQQENTSNYMQYIDFSQIYLPSPPLLLNVENMHTNEENHRTNILHEQNELNILLIGTVQGVVHINIFGAFPCIQLDLNELVGFKCSISDVFLTKDLSELIVTVKDAENAVKIVEIDAEILKKHTPELFAIALKYVRITYLLEIISSSIRNITENWENILLEMDNKLSKFAEKCDGGLTADFLDLLMFGIYSSNMEAFLLHDLTKKGLEKFGQSIEMSYSTIQELLLKYVTKYGQCITYHLSELRGMVRLKFKYDVIGLSEDAISAAISSTGSFLIKAGEMHQIINQSIINFKAFFRWLYTSIMQLLEEQIPVEIPKMTQQDLAYISEFFQNFDKIESKQFVMERLGQYLSNANLSLLPKMDENDWSNFLAENACLTENPVVFEHNIELSLVQQFEKLRKSVSEIFQQIVTNLNKQMKLKRVSKIYTSSYEHNIKVSRIDSTENSINYAFLPSETSLKLVEITRENTRVSNIFFSEFSDIKQGISDMQFYTSDVLTILLRNEAKNTTFLHQFPVNSELFNNNGCGSINGWNFTPKVYKNCEMILTQLAVSGGRKVGIVLSENKRKVKLFEMEGEEEDEEEDISMNISSEA